MILEEVALDLLYEWSKTAVKNYETSVLIAVKVNTK